jgi:hypothetical protein
MGWFGLMAFERRRDFFDDAFDILHHVIVPEPQHEISHCFQNACSIFVGLPSYRVLSAIELDDKVRVAQKKSTTKRSTGNCLLNFQPPSRRSRSQNQSLFSALV